MRHETRLTAARIGRRLELIAALVYRRDIDLPPFRYRMLEPGEPPPLEAEAGDWPIAEPGTWWGAWRKDFVLRTTMTVPRAWGEDSPVALHVSLGASGDFSHPEALVYLDGEVAGATDRHHRDLRLDGRWLDGRPHDLVLAGWTGLGGFDATPLPQLLMGRSRVVEVDTVARAFVATARVALDTALHLDEEPARFRLLNALERAFDTLDTREPLGSDFYTSVDGAREELVRAVEGAGPPLDVDVLATGHAHIDVAWLWTLGQTRHKAARTWHNVLALMHEFDDFHFTQSQPQLYEFVRQDHPRLFETIRKRVAEGRWEPVGGMWVEADCNLSGSESLARQFLLGRSFFEEHFGSGVEAPILWLPDVFGYSWSIPQLIKEAELDYFMTIKIGWNQYNRLPYDTFWWQGVDGTRVLTHFSTTPSGTFVSTYNSKATAEEALGSWRNFQQKELGQELLMLYGYGDGGGGPTREMLENISHLRAMPGAPRVRQGSAREFFDRINRDHGDRLPVWNGELYLEIHRGTYTTQSRNKRANRKSEFLLHDAEFLAAYADQVAPDYSYPADSLRRAWELVCLNQFHDIIPGSSVGEVYTDSLAQYEEVREAGEGARDDALEALAKVAGGDIVIANPTSFERDDVVLCPGHLVRGRGVRRTDGRPAAAQKCDEGVLLAPGPLPPLSITALLLDENGGSPTAASGATANERSLENDLLLVEFDDAGDVARIYDKELGREVLAPGAVGNQWQAFEDRPLNWDAWDVDVFYDDRMWTSEPAESRRTTERGPLRATMEIRRRIGRSSYVQRVSLARRSRRIDFDTWVDWRERHVMLKVAFPVDLLSPVSTHEIQWGNVQRTTHENTSWDWARFETCAQKWVDLSEGDYGVSLLNDCKYGYDVHGNVLRMSLLRSPTAPDPEADQGEHRFVYSLLPHAGDWSETIPEAYALNDPAIVVRGGGSAPRAAQLLTTDAAALVVETVKRAEDGRGVVVRLYESRRTRGTARLTPGWPVRRAWRTNLLERNVAELKPEGESFLVPFRPYEIITLRLEPGGR